jgi:hypothetical protein
MIFRDKGPLLTLVRGSINKECGPLTINNSNSRLLSNILKY